MVETEIIGLELDTRIAKVMEDLFLGTEEFRPIENSTPVPRNTVAVPDSKPSHLIKPLPDETAPRYAEYLGSFPVTEPTPDERAAYVGKQLELISKRNGSSLKPVCIAMTLSGVKICDPTMKEVYMSHALRRISYTTCIPNENLLSFVSRNPGEPLTNQYCHSFRTDHATEINSIIGGAFLTAYTLKRKKKKKRLSLEMATQEDDFDNDTSLDNDGFQDSSSTTTSVEDAPVRHPRKSSSSAAGGESSEEYSPEKKNPITVQSSSTADTEKALSVLESRVFAALNEKAQNTEVTTNGVTRRKSKPGTTGYKDPVLERVAGRNARMQRRPLSYHEIFSRSKSGPSLGSSLQQAGLISDALPEDSAIDFNLGDLRLNEEPVGLDRSNSAGEQGNLKRRSKCMSLDPGIRNMRPSDAYNKARDQERRMRENLEAQINGDTLRSNAGGCAPTKSLSDFFPFRLAKKRREKKKYTRSKTESVIAADNTFDRMWNPRQRLNTSDNVAIRQRTEIVPTHSMMVLSKSPPAPSPTREDDFNKCVPRRSNSAESEPSRGLRPSSRSTSALPRPSLTHSQLLPPRYRSSVASGTASTATTASSCQSSTYLTDATCEDSGMYTQSSNASTSSSDSCGRKSSCHSSGSDSILSGRSAVWYPKSTVNLDSSIASMESRSNAERLRQSLAAQMISTDNFISLDAKLMSAAWYHPGIPIDVAMGILKGEEDGSFLLVRPIRKGASYTLVVSCRNSCKLFNINKIEKVGYHIEGKNQFFPHVYIMIAQYSCHPGPLPFKLKTMLMFNPLCREK